MTATIIPHPAAIAAQLKAERLHWMREAARHSEKGDRNNVSWCKGKASGLNDAIVALGGEPISLAVSDYVVRESGAA